MSATKQEPKEPFKLNIPEYEICPHCHKGNLLAEKQPCEWQFVCSVCGRAWIVLDGKYWLAGFDAAGSIYEVTKDGAVIDRNSFRDEKFREELWSRVRS